MLAINTSDNAIRSPLLLALSACVCMTAIIIPFHLPWFYGIFFIIICLIILYYCSKLKNVQLACCLCASFFCGVMVEQPAEAEQVFFCECAGYVERIYANDYNQRIRLRIDAIKLPHIQPQRFEKISCQLPLSPVLRIGDYIQLRGICYGEQREFYYRWLLRAQNAEIIHYREQGSRAAVWKSIDSLDRYQSVATALVLGIPSYQDQQQFRQAGIAHMLAVSGLHVGIVFLLCAVLLRFLSIPWFFRYGILIAVVITFLWLTGMAIPTQRAAIMAVVLICAQVLGRHLRCYAALGLAAIIIMCMHPYDALSAGFQLSFIAVAGILSVGLGLRRLRMYYAPLYNWPLDRPLWSGVLWITRNTCDALCIGLAASLAVTPLLVWHFHVLNPWSPLASVLVTPAVAVIIMSTLMYSLAACVWSNGPWQGFTTLSEWSLDFLMWVREIIAQWPGSQIEVSSFSMHIFLIWPLMVLWVILSDRRLALLTQRGKHDSHEGEKPDEAATGDPRLVHGLSVI
ncbi:MAG: ComEC/Rec2 family competence protein [Planctomycetes bacterium]|nr:ComEC/Rec2 family competence protein [Planctomycetota bacterium]